MLATQPRRTTAPSRRRNGLSPLAISSTAHHTSPTLAAIDATVARLPSGLNNVRTSVAARNIASGKLGHCAITTSLVVGFRKNRVQPSDVAGVFEDGLILDSFPDPGMATHSTPAVH